MTVIRTFAPAKINLTLHVTNRREDGYHILDSLVVFANIGDKLTVQNSSEPSLTVSGPRANGVPTNHRNLVLRAAALMDIPAQIHLEKHLPNAAGIGGGSSDAAATLKALAHLRDLPVPENAASLGADIPVCLMAHASRMRGIGDVIDSCDGFPVLHAVLVNPNVPVATKAIFANLQSPQNAAMPEALPMFQDARSCITFLQDMRNDLEESAITAQPVIKNVLNAIAQTSGCQLSRMSGSGATCFGLYLDEELAQNAAQNLQNEHKNWWVTATKLS